MKPVRPTKRNIVKLVSEAKEILDEHAVPMQDVVSRIYKEEFLRRLTEESIFQRLCWGKPMTKEDKRMAKKRTKWGRGVPELYRKTGNKVLVRRWPKGTRVFSSSGDAWLKLGTDQRLSVCGAVLTIGQTVAKDLGGTGRWWGDLSAGEGVDRVRVLFTHEMRSGVKRMAQELATKLGWRIEQDPIRLLEPTQHEHSGPRYLKLKSERRNPHVYAWTEVLARRKDTVECDASGRVKR